MSTDGYDIYPRKHILNVLQQLTDHEWLEVLIGSIRERFFQGIELPGFPANELQMQFAGSAGEHTLRDAFNFYCVVKDHLNRLGRPLTHQSRILDFGCGWGRVARFFLRDVAGENLYGIDVDPTVVAICKQTFPCGMFHVVEPQPPTAFDSESFDCIYACSVFSHLSEMNHIQWIEEFSRILRSGGVLVVTTEGRSFIEFCKSLRGQASYESLWHEALARSFLNTEEALADYDNGKFLYSPTGGGGVRSPSFYGEAIIPPAYVEREWTKFLTFRDFSDDRRVLPQASIVMQKTA